MNLLGFPSTTGCRPAAVVTAATMAPVPVGGISDDLIVLVAKSYNAHASR